MFVACTCQNVKVFFVAECRFTWCHLCSGFHQSCSSAAFLEVGQQHSATQPLSDHGFFAPGDFPGMGGKGGGWRAQPGTAEKSLCLWLRVIDTDLWWSLGVWRFLEGCNGNWVLWRAFPQPAGRSKNVDTSKFYKLLEVDKCLGDTEKAWKKTVKEEMFTSECEPCGTEFILAFFLFHHATSSIQSVALQSEGLQGAPPKWKCTDSTFGPWSALGMVATSPHLKPRNSNEAEIKKARPNPPHRTAQVEPCWTEAVTCCNML